jgi:DNA invertase Pin-like site-specific DNA recombinase
MQKAVILARVSTKDQEEYGHSLPAQTQKLREYAQRKGFVLGFLKAQKDMPALLCQNVDRVTRNFRDAVDLDDMRINDGLEIHFEPIPLFFEPTRI